MRVIRSQLSENTKVQADPVYLWTVHAGGRFIHRKWFIGDCCWILNGTVSALQCFYLCWLSCCHILAHNHGCMHSLTFFILYFDRVSFLNKIPLEESCVPSVVHTPFSTQYATVYNDTIMSCNFVARVCRWLCTDLKSTSVFHLYYSIIATLLLSVCNTGLIFNVLMIHFQPG